MDNFSTHSVQQSDQDFEQFVCSACHNLREPLRELRLRTEPANGQKSQIEDQIRTMESLLEGMEEYSLVFVGENRHSRVEMNSVLNTVRLLLDQQVRDAAAVVTHDPL